jgi:D-alanyl-D-alanine carboxypeptidase
MRLIGLVLALATLALAPAHAEPLSPALAQQVDAVVGEVLRKVDAPSASIAIVQDGQIAYLKAYGVARLNPTIAATPETRYGVASVSKQFTAAAILLLAQDGKLTLDDKVGQYVPGLTAGDRVTLRQLLSHTAGYRDWWPQDFVFEAMRGPITPQGILDGWARIPLDFEPGTEWQYSNTGFVAAGLVVEKVSGQPLLQFLQERVFAPLAMTGVTEDDTGPLQAPDAANYTRYGLGPVVAADKEGPGWLFGSSELAMRPKDLALWNISLMDRSLLSPASYLAMTTPAALKSGEPTRYGLGVGLSTIDGRRLVSHGGALSGVLTDNRVWPDDRLAVTVIVNADYGSAQGAIADRLAFLLLPSRGAAATARTVLAQLQAGTLDEAVLTPNAKAWFTPARRAEFAASLAPLGPLRDLDAGGVQKRGGLTYYGFDAVFGTRTLSVVMRTASDGKVEQFLIGPKAD